MNTKFDSNVYIWARHFCGCCPKCRLKVVTAVIHRASKDSVTLKCKRCRIKWQVTWKSLYQALEQELAEYPVFHKKRDAIFNVLMDLRKEVNVKGVHRFTPRGKKGSEERKTLLKIWLKDSKNRFSQED